jgi:hypothetical protein
MLEIAICSECGVPEPLIAGQVWLNNGDIVQKANPRARMSFIECENLDPLFRNIGDIMGVSIEQMLVGMAAQGSALYMKQMVPSEIKDLVLSGQVSPETLAEPILTYCHILGYGRYELTGYLYRREEDDYAKFRIASPFSVPLAAGTLAGTLSALVGGEHRVTYEEISPQNFEFTTHWTHAAREQNMEVLFFPYRHRDGDLELERCAGCGAPKALGNYLWVLEKGLIVSEHTGRRVAVLGPELFDYLFKSLEEELGETLPEVVVEAQRRFVRTGFYSFAEISNEGDFRTQLALRGLGNLREITMGPPGLFMRIDNAANYLMTVGMVQGLFELAFDVETHVDWAISNEGNLEVEINPKA